MKELFMIRVPTGDSDGNSRGAPEILECDEDTLGDAIDHSYDFIVLDARQFCDLSKEMVRTVVGRVYKKQI